MVAEVTDRLHKLKTDAGEEEEIVVEGFIADQAPQPELQAGPAEPVDRMVNYDQKNEEDEPGAIQNARDVKLPFNKHDIKLWFSLIESKMQFAGIKHFKTMG